MKGRFPLVGPYGSAVAMAAGLVLLLFGVTLAATWVIRAYARRVGRRARSAEALLVEADPRAWARALSVVGLTVFFGAGAGAQQAVIAALPICAVTAVAGVAVVVLSLTDVYQVRWLGWAAARAVAMAGIGVLAAVLVALAARPLLRGTLRLERLRA